MNCISKLVIVRGGLASGKVAFSKRLAEQEGRVVIDLDLFQHRDAASKVDVVRELLQAGQKVVVADVFPLKSDIERFVALRPDADVLEMDSGQLPENWEAYPDATLIKLN